MATKLDTCKRGHDTTLIDSRDQSGSCKACKHIWSIKYHREYDQSERGKQRTIKYGLTEKDKLRRERYQTSEKGKLTKIKYRNSLRGHETALRNQYAEYKRSLVARIERTKKQIKELEGQLNV